MQDSMYAYMKPGLVHFKAYPQVMQGRDYVATLEKICEDDFWTAVELGPVKDTRERDKARKMLEVSHLTVCYATQPTILPMKLNPHHFDAAERGRVLRIIKDDERVVVSTHGVAGAPAADHAGRREAGVEGQPGEEGASRGVDHQVGGREAQQRIYIVTHGGGAQVVAREVQLVQAPVVHPIGQASATWWDHELAA